MALAGRRVTVTTAATRIDVSDIDGLGRSLAITNAGSAAIDLGASTVTSGAGYSLAAGASVSVDLGPGESLYGIVATGTQVVHVLEAGV